MKNKLFFILCIVLNLVQLNCPAQTVSWATYPCYGSLEQYTDQLYKIRENGKVGLADISGKMMIAARYDSITPFAEHLALALEYEQGKYVIKGIINDRNFGVVDVQEKYYISEKYPYFTEGKLVVCNVQNKYGYLQEDGRLFKPCQYMTTYPFYNGLACVRKAPKEVAYLRSSGDELITDLERDGYTLLAGSSFNEQGEAYVQAKGVGMKHCIIDTEGTIIRNAQYSGKKLTNYNFREPYAFHEGVTNTDADGVDAYCENNLYGYKANGKNIITPQFNQADSFRKGYARVKFGDKYGVLKLDNGNFNGHFTEELITVKNGKIEKATFRLSIPEVYQGKNITLKITEDGKNTMSYELDTLGDCTFMPNPRNEVRELDYYVSAVCDDILLWQGNCRLNFKYIKNLPPVLHAPQVASDFKIDENGYVRANKENQVEVFAIIENKSMTNLSVTITIDGNGGIQPKTEMLQIIPNGSGRISSVIDNIKERKSVEINVSTDGGLKTKAIIKVKPFI